MAEQFKVRDRVKVIQASSGARDILGLEGKVIRMDTNMGANQPVVVEFDNVIQNGHDGDGIGKPGHCWYMDSHELENIETFNGEEKETTRKLKEKPRKIEIEVCRQNGTSTLKFTIDPTVEEMFKQMSKRVKTSKSWGSLKFYTIPSLLQNEDYKALLQKYGLFDNYGHSFLRGKSLNIAFLRTVGGVGDVKVDADLPFAVLSQNLKRLSQFVQEFHDDFLQNYTIKSEIELTPKGKKKKKAKAAPALDEYPEIPYPFI